jgi:hypothetical protein
MKPKVLATDIDGTITTKDDKLDEGAIKAIRAVERHGVPVVLCSEQHALTVLTLRDYIGATGPIVAEGGAVVGKDLGALKVYGSREFGEQACEVLKEKFKLKPRASNAFRQVDLAFERTFCWRAAAELLKERGVKANIIDTGWAFHLRDARIDKAFGLKKVARILKIPLQRIAAIGDYLNDIPMLQAAGYAIALGNAPLEVKVVSDYVCKRSYARGFVEAVRHLNLAD